MADQQKSKMAAQQETDNNSCDTLYKNLQHNVHEIKVYELQPFLIQVAVAEDYGLIVTKFSLSI